MTANQARPDRPEQRDPADPGRHEAESHAELRAEPDPAREPDHVGRHEVRTAEPDADPDTAEPVAADAVAETGAGAEAEPEVEVDADAEAVEATAVIEPEPILSARGLGLTVGGRPVFQGVDLDVPPGTLAVVVGLAGAGRSSLLLALSGRMATTAGTLRVGGTTKSKIVREHTAVARITGFIELEPRLTVGEAITERALLDGVAVRAGRRAVRQAAAVLGLPLDGDVIDEHVLVEDLTALHRTLLSVATACARSADLLVLDDVDAGLDIADQAAVFTALAALAATGPAVVVTTTDTTSLPAGVLSIHLDQPEDLR